MWMATKNGFFSIVKIKGSNRYFIRARVKKDLLNCFPSDRIFKSDKTDYRFRVVVDKEELNNFVLSNSEIEYTNFKDSLKGTNQEDKLQPYYQIWWAMYDYQVESSFSILNRPRMFMKR